MEHYFDDIMHRHRRSISDGLTPPPPGRRNSMPRMRRSSTARSLGLRSDFEVTSVNGSSSAPHHGADDDDDESVDPHSGPAMGNSVQHLDPERQKEREEADKKMHEYIADQLQRIKSDDELEQYSQVDEFEATA